MFTMFLLDFNSIKVRLKHNQSYWTDKYIDRFQFHKGTIKTVQKACFGFFEDYFNSIKVR